ncbi:MAG: STAS/SEC14 domain-containing protein [Chloroflexota bacterium]|nr:STAS/SEC14 domain-containing protein [Chloroflexota bacterium]
MTSTLESEYAWEPLGSDGVATIRYKPGAMITEEMARKTVGELMVLTNGKRIALLADIRQQKSITREARLFYGNATHAYAALALLAGSPATRLIANFFIGLSHPKVPTQIFTDEEKAVAWLRRYTD